MHCVKNQKSKFTSISGHQNIASVSTDATLILTEQLYRTQGQFKATFPRSTSRMTALSQILFTFWFLAGCAAANNSNLSLMAGPTTPSPSPTPQSTVPTATLRVRKQLTSRPSRFPTVSKSQQTPP